MQAATGAGSHSQSELQRLFSTGKNHLLNGNFPNARFTLERCLENATDPTLRLDVHNLLGQCCYAMGDKDLSKRHFEAGVLIGDKSERGLLITGFCLSWLGKKDEGIQLGHEVLEKNPKSIEAYVLLMKIYQTKNDEKKALEMRIKIAELEAEKEKERERQIRSILPNNVVELSLEPFLVPASDTERVKEVLLSNGFLDLGIGQYEEALEEFEELLQMVPDHVKALYGASCCYVALEKKNKASELLAKALEIDPDFQDAKKLQKILLSKSNTGIL